MVIPEHLRPTFPLPPMPTDLKTLNEAIVFFVESTHLQCAPMRHITVRYGKYSKRFGSDITKVMRDLSSSGALAVHRMDMLNRTYVFSISQWNEMWEDKAFDWHQYEMSLKDYK